MSDVLTDVLEALRIRTTLFAMADLVAPWGVRFPASNGAYFHTVRGAGCWLHVPPAAPRHLGAGDVVLLAHGTAHRVTGGRRDAARVEFDPKTWSPNRLVEMPPAAAGSAPTTLVCGAIDVIARSAQPLLALLEPVVVVDAGAAELGPTLELLRREVERIRPGSQTVLARLGDVLLVQLVRVWLERSDTVDRGWLGALKDPQITAALQAMHADPAAPWTVASLAARSQLSRSRFAERFAATTGDTPLGYLTRWRLTIAAGMLRDGQPVGRVGRAVGYTSEPAFSRAFRRQHGEPPARLRTRG